MFGDSYVSNRGRLKRSRPRCVNIAIPAVYSSPLHLRPGSIIRTASVSEPGGTLSHDLAHSRELTFREHMRPICIQVPNPYRERKRAGWGTSP